MAAARLAWFILAHHKPGQLRWLFEAIYDPRDLFLIHVDAKSLLGIKPERDGTWAMARRLAAGRANVRLLRPRFTNWGGWSLSRLQLDAIDRLLADGPDWSYFVNVSGQCYPIRPLAELRAMLAQADGQAFVEMRPFASLPPDDWHLQMAPMREWPHRAIRLQGRRTPPGTFTLDHKGSQWCMLPRAFCDWQRAAPVRPEIERYLRGLLLSDELVVQALVRNGPWRERLAPHYGREIVWPGPKVMTLADAPLLAQSPGYIARKFDAGVDEAVLHALAQRIGAPVPRGAVPEASSRRAEIREPAQVEP